MPDTDSERYREYAPCPNCGAKSLAAIVDHICQDCADLYRLCLKCQPDYPFTDNDEGDDGV